MAVSYAWPKPFNAKGWLSCRLKLWFNAEVGPKRRQDDEIMQIWRIWTTKWPLRGNRKVKFRFLVHSPWQNENELCIALYQSSLASPPSFPSTSPGSLTACQTHRRISSSHDSGQRGCCRTSGAILRSTYSFLIITTLLRTQAREHAQTIDGEHVSASSFERNYAIGVR